MYKYTCSVDWNIVSKRVVCFVVIAVVCYIL